MQATTVTVEIPEAQASQRLDAALAALVPDLSRARLQALLAAGQVSHSGSATLKANAKVKAGEIYQITIPAPIEATPQPQAIPLTIHYEDEHLLVIDKPAGLVVHPAAGNADGTLVNALLAHCGDSLSGIGGVKRPGIVHRLDKDTSGLMVVAKSDAAHRGLAAQFAAAADGSRELSREYLAITHGLAPASATVSAFIGRDTHNRQKMAVVEPDGERARGKHAVTHLTREANFGTLASLVRCVLETGRTHQIRVHLLHAGFPIVGDPLYGKKRQVGLPPLLRAFPRQALHAARLRFTHPVSRKPLEFKADLPDDMAALLDSLKSI